MRHANVSEGFTSNVCEVAQFPVSNEFNLIASPRHCFLLSSTYTRKYLRRCKCAHNWKLLNGVQFIHTYTYKSIHQIEPTPSQTNTLCQCQMAAHREMHGWIWTTFLLKKRYTQPQIDGEYIDDILTYDARNAARTHEYTFTSNLTHNMSISKLEL